MISCMIDCMRLNLFGNYTVNTAQSFHTYLSTFHLSGLIRKMAAHHAQFIYTRNVKADEEEGAEEK